MTNEELGQLLSKIDKKLDKILKLTTVLAKAYHLVPVSEKEERDMAIAQRKNAAVMQKVQEELAALEPVKEDHSATLDFNKILDASTEEVYDDILGSDIM